jgi:hypothetical protein
VSINKNIPSYNFYCLDMISSELSAYNICVSALLRGNFSCDVRHPEGIDLSIIMERLTNALQYGCLELFFIPDDVKYTTDNDVTTIEFTPPKYPLDNISKMYDELDKKINIIIKTVGSIDNSVNKILALNNYFCNNIKYTRNPTPETGDAYGALVGGAARYEGIAKAAKIIFDRLGYKSIILFGEASTDGSEELHAWNIAEIDGKWYKFDFTWCISRTITDLKIPCVEYLFLTDSEMALEHSSDIKNHPVSTDISKAFWELNKSVVRYSADFSNIKPIEHGNNYYIVAKLTKKPRHSEVKEDVFFWYNNEICGPTFSTNFSYVYNKQLGVLTLYLLNE